MSAFTMFDQHDDATIEAMYSAFLDQQHADEIAEREALFAGYEDPHYREPVTLFDGFDDYGCEQVIDLPRGAVAQYACRQPRNCHFYMPWFGYPAVRGGPHQDMEIPF